MKKSIGSGRGSVYNIILKALQSGDKYGYEICKEVEEKTLGAYILKQPSLYSGLKRLEAQGEVSSYWRDSVLGGRRHYYTLTEKGKNRIENSNFNWQDARDEIVGGLFEKSELEKTIETVESDIDEIKSTSLFDENLRQSANEVIESTENLAKEFENDVAEQEKDFKTDNDIEEEQVFDLEIEEDDEVNYFDSSANDLFSMFSTVSQNEDKKNKETEKETDEIIENFKENESDSTDDETNFEEYNKINKEEKFEEKKQSKGIEEQTDLFSFVEQNEIKENEDETLNEQINNAKSDENINDFDNSAQQKEEQNEDIAENAWQDIENNLKTTKESEIESSSNEYEQEQEESEVILEKNSQNVVEEYKKSNLAFNSYIDNSQAEEETQSFFATNENNYPNQQENVSLFETSFELNEEQQNEQEENIQNVKENEELSEIAEREESKEDVISTNDKTEEIKTEQSAVDYKDIFGDLISSGNSSTELDDELVYNASQVAEEEKENKFDTDKTDNFVVETFNKFENENSQAQQTSIIDELPRNEYSLKDINRTLMFDTNSQEKHSISNFEKYDQTPFKESNSFESYSSNPFEKYDTYQNIEENVQNKRYETVSNSNKNIQKSDNMSFDKKYSNAYNKFEVPDYEVRYFRKSNTENSISKFLSINKLNLVKSFILSLLICIMTTVLLIVVATKVEIVGFQMFMFIFSYLIAFGTLIYNFIKYTSNKNKKVQKLPRNESMYSTFVAIVLVILSLAINLFMGMSFDNIVAYFGSLFLPIFFALIIIINYPLKKFLSKFASFYD